jgi:3-hydroxyisobutyrate dehydrogenase
MNLGLIGTGLMGKAMAIKLIENGYSLNIYNRTYIKAKDLAELGASIYDSPNKIVKDSDIIILMLSDYDAIYDVLITSNIGGFDGKTVIQMSTIAPNESIEIEKRINKLNGEYFEAPVLGSILQIANGELIILVGGSDEQYEKTQKLFACLGKKKNILHIGVVGKAAAIKLALNQLIISETVAFSMSLGYLIENNLDIDLFMEILRSSALYAPTFDKKLPSMLNRNFEKPNFPLKHLLKDLDLILGEFSEGGIDTNSLKGIRRILLNSIEKGFGDSDYSALYNSVHPNKSESKL